MWDLKTHGRSIFCWGGGGNLVYKMSLVVSTCCISIPSSMLGLVVSYWRLFRAQTGSFLRCAMCRSFGIWDLPPPLRLRWWFWCAFSSLSDVAPEDQVPGMCVCFWGVSWIWGAEEWLLDFVLKIKGSSKRHPPVKSSILIIADPLGWIGTIAAAWHQNLGILRSKWYLSYTSSCFLFGEKSW